jgi:hypothetical protein
VFSWVIAFCKKPDSLLMNNDQQTLGIIAEANLLTLDTNKFSYFCFFNGKFFLMNIIFLLDQIR